MVKIGIDTRITHYRVGGISTYIRQLISALESLIPPHDIRVFQSRKSRESLSDKFASAKLWTPPHHRLERLTLSVELTRHNLDIFHATDFIPPRFGAKRHVITVHDLTFLHYPQHKDAEAIRYYNDQIQYAVDRADHILSVSQATKNDLMTLLNVPESKITIQPNGVTPQFKVLDQTFLQAQRSALKLPKKYILTVGTLEPRKNISTLLSAYEKLPKELRETHALLLVGQVGWLFDDTMTRIKTLQEAGYNIIVRSDITDEQLPLVYNLAEVFTFPSYYEGFGLPALEAMACGTPVISSDTSSLPEVIGNAGLFFTPENHEMLAQLLTQVLSDEACQQDLHTKGLDRASQFTWERSAKIALSVYDALG